MRQSISIAAILILALTDATLAAQGPGVSGGTAGALAQWLAVLCGIGLATLGVVFSRRDDGSYGDF